VLFAAIAGLALTLKKKMRRLAGGSGGGGILNGVPGNAGGAGYFRLDGKEGLLNGLGVSGGGTEKSD
jgi:hypothetical protein